MRVCVDTCNVLSLLTFVCVRAVCIVSRSLYERKGGCVCVRVCGSFGCEMDLSLCLCLLLFAVLLIDRHAREQVEIDVIGLTCTLLFVAERQ